MTGARPRHVWDRLVADVRGGPGPTLLCTGGVHGNEHAGLLAAREVAERLERLGEGALRGRFVAAAGHLAALNSGDDAVRYFEQDLNRLWREETIAAARAKEEAARTPDERELLELEALLRAAAAGAEGRCVLLDLHTVSSPSCAFCCVEDSLPARRLGLALGLPLILGFEEELQGLLIDFATRAMGVPALVVEAGLHDAPESVRVHAAAIWVMLEELGMVGEARALAREDVRGRLAQGAGAQAGRVFDIRGREAVGEPALKLDARAQAFRRVRMGRTRVGERRYGGGVREIVRAPADGVLFMPNRQKRRRAQDDAYFILRPVWRRFMGVSAWLRGRAWAHAMLAALPGVRRDRADPHTLVVDHEVAALMARDVLHLFGYRVHEWRASPYRRRAARLAMACWVLPLALLRAAGLAPRSGRDVWVVRRRRLDIEEAVRAAGARRKMAGA